jgi:hypothetical protein
MASCITSRMTYDVARAVAWDVDRADCFVMLPLVSRMCARRSRRAPGLLLIWVAIPHSITSSARASTVSGTVSPSAFAVLRLITV